MNRLHEIRLIKSWAIELLQQGVRHGKVDDGRLLARAVSDKGRRRAQAEPRGHAAALGGVHKGALDVLGAGPSHRSVKEK